MDAKALFEILVREHAPMLTVYLRSVVRDPALADDLFQESMLVAWRNLERFDRKRTFGPWLRGIAARLVLAQRRRAVSGWLLCDAEVLEHIDHRLELVESQRGDTLDEKLHGLRDCIAALPETYREAVRLRYLEEIPSDTLAARLSVTAETLKKRLQRSRARLLECLSRKLSIAEAVG